MRLHTDCLREAGTDFFYFLWKINPSPFSNDVGLISSSKVTLGGGEMTFNDFSIGTQFGFMGYGEPGALELLRPLRQMLDYAQVNGAKKITLTGRYASDEGSILGTGSPDNRNTNFSFSFPATSDGLKGFIGYLRGLGQ